VAAQPDFEWRQRHLAQSVHRVELTSWKLRILPQATAVFVIIMRHCRDGSVDQRELSGISHVSGCAVRHGGQFSRQLRKSMPIDRVRADQYLALLGFALSFLFLLAVVALAFTVTNGTRDAPPASIAAPAK
jgi:hypothetical protein